MTTEAVQAIRKDSILSKVLRYTRRGWPTPVPEALKSYYSRKTEITIEDNCLLWGIRVIIPNSLQASLLKDIHQGHPGISKIKSVARSHFWWPGLDSDLEHLAKSCQSCQAVKQAPPAAPLQPWTWPGKPWERVHIDFAGPFLSKIFLVATDAHSKWPEIFEMRQTTTSKTIAILRHLFARYGLPEQIVSDNGPQFTSAEFTEFLRKNGVQHIRSAPYHPASNGAAERLVRTSKESIKAGERDGLTLQHRLENFLFTYRTTPHSTTQVAPCSLFLGRSLHTWLDLIHPNVGQRVRSKQAKQKQHHDQHAHHREFQVGQRVMTRNYRSGPD